MINDKENKECIVLLNQILENQKEQLKLQKESLSLQREQFQLYRGQYEKAEQINARAAALQDKSADLVNRLRKMLPVVLAVIFVLIVYLTWLLSRMGVL